MRIACPNCHALYDVPDDLIGGRPRRLRCEQCGHGWRVSAQGREEAVPGAGEAGLDETVAVKMPPAAFSAGKAVEADDSAGVSEVLSRRFGKAADDEAKAEIQAALRDEQAGHEPPPEPDRFADLVRAARNNHMEFESDAPDKKRAGALNPRLVTALLVLLALALIVVERHAVMKLIPASAGLFHALHLG
ncbi:zinc-ribbon domain-containing protein [Acidocella sp.]|uniref:zinc-ribbon domain-containing protein n=1 Tax=Acidocella sp. TaxID=50710 RepID=UPI003D093008